MSFFLYLMTFTTENTAAAKKAIVAIMMETEMGLGFAKGATPSIEPPAKSTKAENRNTTGTNGQILIRTLAPPGILPFQKRKSQKGTTTEA